MGEVYRARDPRLGREVAIKILPASFSSDPERLHRFEQEAKATAALNHANILTVHEIGSYEGAPFIVSELPMLIDLVAAAATPLLRAAMEAGRIRTDGHIVTGNGNVRVMKAAIDPVWYLPGIAARFEVSERALRRDLHEQTGGMYPDLVNREDLKVLLPPIGGTTIYMFGDPEKLGDGKTPLACRVHDECNGSDVFGSDICTCRPYLAHGIEICVEMAQAGGVGLVVYNRKEGRALGEVTKFLVYNARKRQPAGDRPETYFKRTECVAGVPDMRFQELMPDVLHWLGVTRIHRFASMSDMKYDALVRQGIQIDERVAIPDERIPADARVEIEAKIAAGYFDGAGAKANAAAVGRALDD